MINHQLINRLEQSVSMHPEMPAVYFDGNTLSYKTYFERISVFKAVLTCHHIEYDYVLFLTPKTPDALCAIWAALYNNCAYVPLEFTWPTPFIIDRVLQSKTSWMVCATEFESIIAQHFKIIVKESLSNNLFLLKIETENDNAFQNNKHHAYILFTSGSTGSPKGVCHTANSLFHFLNWNQQYLSVKTGSRFVSVTSWCFDLSLFDLFLPVFSASVLYMPTPKEAMNSRAFMEFINSSDINYVYTTPTMLRLFRSSGKLSQTHFQQLSCLLFAGEVFSVTDLQYYQQLFPHIDFYNYYGPTETNVCMLYKVPSHFSQFSHYGIPLGNVAPGFEMQLDEKTSELLVCSDFIFDTYFGQPQYGTDAMVVKENKKWYKTGDLITIENGCLYFRGRKDRQLKINGYRIEPLQIETVYLEHPQISQVQVLFKKESNELVLYYSSPIAIPALDLKIFGIDLMPTYMVPARFIWVNNWPLTVSGKTDETALLKL